MVDAIIIEDEKPAARRLQRMLEEENIRVIGVLNTVKEGIEWFHSHPLPDLILADIRLPDGTSFDIFEQIKPRTPVIFTTAYDRFAIKAFKYYSVDYLLKPLVQKELHTALRKYGQYQNIQMVDYQKIFREIFPEKAYRQYFSVLYGMHMKSISVREINCFTSRYKATFICTSAGKMYDYESSLEQLEGELNPADFFRVNRKFIIRRQVITDIIRYSNSRLKLQIEAFDDEDIIVAREKVKAFKQWLEM